MGKDDESIIPTLMTKACAPKSLFVVVSCKCIKSECRGRCFCQKEGLPCIGSCSCGARDTCNNPCKMIGVDNDSDGETDEEHAIEDEIIPKLNQQKSTVNPEIFARILFSRMALYDIFAKFKIRDYDMIYQYQ